MGFGYGGRALPSIAKAATTRVYGSAICFFSLNTAISAIGTTSVTGPPPPKKELGILRNPCPILKISGFLQKAVKPALQGFCQRGKRS